MRFVLSQSGLKSVITAGIFSLVAIGILFNWAVPVSAQNAVPTKPDAPTLLALAKGMVEVDWNDVSGANGYEVQFYTSSGWIDLPNAGLGIEIVFYGSRAVATSLPEDMGYDSFRVRAGNSVGWSEWSEYAWQMTTHNMEWEGVPATGAPAISGTAQVGETLTASTSGIADADGLTNVSYRYQWIRNDVSSDRNIRYATGTTYTLVAADEGQTIKVKVRFDDDEGNEETLTSAETDAVAPVPCPGASYNPTPTDVEVDSVPIVVTSTTDDYFVLYVRGTTVDLPVLVKRGEAGTTSLAENVKALTKERYRVEKYLIADPADVDGDCIDDITELDDLGTNNPVNAAGSLDLNDGAVGIPDPETFEVLARDGEHLKFVVFGLHTKSPRMYFHNTSTHPNHMTFLEVLLDEGLEQDRANVARGYIDYHPSLEAADGSPGVYVTWDARLHRFRDVNILHTLIAANMLLIEQNLVYLFNHDQLLQIQHELPLYETSRIPLIFHYDLWPEANYVPLNEEVGFGLLRVLEPDERPSFRDVVIYETLPNNLPRVAGIISTVPQTPLSHVNLRAVQDGIPNAFIRGATDSSSIAGLIGSHVRYEVSENGYTIRAATRQEVDAHYESSRPATSQTLQRDLSVTEIRPLSEIGFDDWDAFGVKAANVAVLGTFGFPEGTVPDGFAIPFYFYDEFMKHNDFYTRIETMLADADFQENFDTQDEELKDLRDAIEDGETPAWILTALADMNTGFPQGTTNRKYRSSTNNEDLPGFNGAGLYDSKSQKPDEDEEDGLDKSLKEVYASLWTFRAFTERDFHRIDHLTAAMGILVHPSYQDELVNGVAVSFKPIQGVIGWGYYVNSQVGEDLVTNPEAHSVPEELLLYNDGSYRIVATSNQVAPGELLMSSGQIGQLRQHLQEIHNHFKGLYNPAAGDPFAMEIEFKITSENKLAIKQARPWVFSGVATAPLGKTLPSAPINLAVAPGDTSLTVVWDLPANTGGENPTAYDVRYIKTSEDETDDANWTEQLRAWIESSGVMSYPITDLETGEQYDVQVRAENSVGKGSWSASETGTPTVSLELPSTNTAGVSLSKTALTVMEEDTAGETYTVVLDSQPMTDVEVTVAGHAGTEVTPNPTTLTFTGSNWETVQTVTVSAGADADTIDGAVTLTHSAGSTDSAYSGITIAGVTVTVNDNDTTNTPATGAPTISGTAQVGEMLTADTSDVEDGNGLDRVQFRFQWVSHDGSADTDIASATDSTYTLAASDEGKTIKVRVAFTDRGGYAESLTSAATATVAAAPNSPATGAPVISGTAEVGNTLTADTSDIADADGLSGATFTHQWIANDGTADTDKQDATDSIYTLVAADEGKTIKMRVSFTDDAGNVETLTSTATSSVAARPNSAATGAPIISGTAQVGETLTADTSGIGDADGLTNVSYSYQWIRNDGNSDTNITDATDSTYTLVAADEGKTIKGEVSFADDAGNDETLTSIATSSVVARPNSAATGAPTISGTAQVGETLTADTTGIGDADGLTNVSYSYQWIRNDGSSDTGITDAADSSYTLVAADDGKTIKVRVSFTDDAANDETLTSTATEAVSFAVQQQIANSPATGAPTISGAAQVGEALTADTSGIADTDGLVNATFRYQWMRNDGTSETDIQNATGSTYTLVDNDEGQTIKVKVSFTDDAGNDETLSSGATDAVAAPECDNIGDCDIEDVDDLLLPDLVSYQHDYSVAEVVVPPDGAEFFALRFAGYVTNLGDGPLDLRGNPQLADDADLASHDVWQRALTIDGDWVNLTKPPIDFEVDDGHDHFHVMGIVEYSLWDTSGTVEISSGAKVGFCLIDVMERPDLHPNPGPKRHEQWDPDNYYCQSGRPRAKILHMGISEGWQDIYSFSTTFQWIDVSDVRPGYYRIGQRADPDNVIVESDETNNGLALSQLLHVVPGYVARPETVSVEPDAAVRFKLSVYEYFDDTNLEPRTRAHRIVTQPSHGSLDVGDTVTVIVDGATYQVFTDEWVTYTPDPGYDGVDSFTFVALDVLRPMYPINPVVAKVTVLSAGKVGITGSPRIGEILTATTTGIADADGFENASISYQWIRNGGGADADIMGATDSNYVLVDADRGSTIKVRVSFTDDAGYAWTLTSEATAQVSAPLGVPELPVGTAVFIGGVDLEWDDVIWADSYDVQLYQNGQWIDLPGDGVEIAFYGAGAIISGLDPSLTLWFQVRARNAHGSSDWSDFSSLSSTNQFTLGKRARSANEAARGAPVINGTAQVGEILTADTTGIEDGNGLDRVQFRFQWATNDGSADTDIAGATNSTYTLAGSDEGKTIKVRVAFTDRGGYAESLTSDATETVSFAGQQQIANNPATGGPIIGGTVQVGETLATDVLGIADEDGLENATFSYQWISNDGTTDADIQGETGATYTLTDANKGKTVKVRVSFTDDADNEETVTSAATATVVARPNRPATGAPIIGGTVRVGETLATDVLGIADEDGLENATFSYQWISNDGTTDADIRGETGATYTLASAYVGKTIKVKVTFTDDADNEETLTSPATAEVAAGVPTDLPAKPRNLTGTANADGTVTLRWDAPDDDSVTGYQILRRRPTEGERTLLVHVNDTGSTATEYTDNDVTPDVLHTYRVTTINAVGLSRRSEFVNVTPTQPAEPAQNAPATGTPTISGTAQVGETLTADTSGIADADGLIGATYSYQWIRSDGSTDTDIQHATGSTYTLVEADEGQTIKVEVSFTDDAGNDETLSSGVTDAVAAPEPPAKPTGLSAAAVSHDAVTLAWDDPQDDAITGYIILRRDREIHPVGTFITITGDTGSADTTYTDDTVEPDKQYNYKVKAINEHGEVSERSDWVRANTPAVPVPDKPTGLSAAVSHDAVTLTWDDPQDDAITGYVILRRDRAIHPVGTFVTITDDTGSTDTTYTDATVEPDKQYVYRIKAINEHGEVSEKSDWIRADTPAAPSPAG